VPVALKITPEAQITYEAAAMVLNIPVDGGIMLRYMGVPHEVYRGIISTARQQEFFDSEINGNFPYMRG
jgi:hypothetical protein